MRTVNFPDYENTECPRGFNDVPWHYQNNQKSRFFVITKMTLQTLLNPVFGTTECASS